MRPDPFLRILIDVYDPAHEETGLIYTSSRMQPLEWIHDQRFDGYLTFEFQEMLNELRKALKRT